MAVSAFSLSPAVNFETDNGGTLKMVGLTNDLTEYGVTNDGWAFFDDLYFNAYSEATLNVADHHTQTQVTHIGGKVAASFRLVSLVPNGKADIRVRGLTPNEWYRLEFGGVMAETDSGVAHGRTDGQGEIIFTAVSIPNE
ncbi:hypothetical protein [Haloferax larsenii]|uniref:Uncharacterized protein n=1 Tax=Haloferax larsenii TaxID=302484 RepID=A0A1H7N0U8_HALLR|nr:hypothetical protein [Haloferax larsenii]SEL17113.1 hypothetical protein SAMN04488691_103158 [Haloferax larsenii]